MAQTALDTLYLVNKTNQKISIEIITGGIEQTSTITAELDNQRIVDGINGYFPETIIGNNKELNGKTLIIACTIADTSRNTNYTELVVRIKGGISFREYTLFKNVEEEGDSVDYVCLIQFYNP